MGAVVDAGKDLVAAPLDVVGKAVEVVGKDVVDDALGLDKIGTEIGRWGEDIQQVSSVLKGEYAERAAKVEERQEYVNSQINDFNINTDKLQDKVDSLLAFHEIFQMAAANRLDEYVNKRGAELDKLVAEVNAMIKQLQSDFDFVIGLTQGSFLERLVGSVIMILGGILNDVGAVFKGDISTDLLKRIVVDVLIVIAVYLAIPTGGASLWAVAGFVLTVIGSLMTLDGMYANGAATGAIMSALDFMFNDLLNLDDLVGKDFNKFDKDHEDYQQMVMFTKIAIALAAIATGMVGNTGSDSARMSASQSFASKMGLPEEMSIGQAIENSAYQQTAVRAGEVTSYAGGVLKLSTNNALTDSSVFGIKFSTYSDIYKAYEKAQSIGDVVTANEQYKALQEKLAEDKEKLDRAIFQLQTKSFVKSYKDMAYIQQDQQEYIDRYIWGMVSQSMYVDPYGTTPVANMRFTPDKDTRIMSFGFEDLFDMNKLAGSRGYFNSIIYG